MKNLIACGDVLDYPVPAATTIVAGQPILIGDVLGVALNGSSTEGEIIAVQIHGVFELTKNTHATTAAIPQGSKVYWDAGASVVTNTVGANKHIGYGYVTAASTASVAQVKLLG